MHIYHQARLTGIDLDSRISGVDAWLVCFTLIFLNSGIDAWLVCFSLVFFNSGVDARLVTFSFIQGGQIELCTSFGCFWFCLNLRIIHRFQLGDLPVMGAAAVSKASEATSRMICLGVYILSLE